MTTFKYIYLTLFFLFVAQLVFAVPTDTAQIDDELYKFMDKISHFDRNEYEKLVAINKELLKYLKSVCLDPNLMTVSLKKASNAGLMIADSSDNKLRYYSWDTQTGGTMHFFYSVVVYDSGNENMKVQVLVPQENLTEPDSGSCYEKIYTINCANGKIVYIAQDLFIGSTICHGRKLQSFIIANGKLTKYPFFNTGKKLLDSISYDFAGYGSDVDTILSKDKKILKIPLIKPSVENSCSSGIGTGKFLIYRFNGSCFKYEKTR